MEIKIRNNKYELKKDYGDTINTINLEEYITEYYDNFDYIVGDWAYGKLRLKGFYESNNKKAKKMNDISGLTSYIETKCAYGCKWFQLKVIK